MLDLNQRMCHRWKKLIALSLITSFNKKQFALFPFYCHFVFLIRLFLNKCNYIVLHITYIYNAKSCSQLEWSPQKQMVGCSDPATGQSLRNGETVTHPKMATSVNVRDPRRNEYTMSQKMWQVKEPSQRPKALKLDISINL